MQIDERDRLQRLCDEQALWIEKAKHLLPAVNDMRAAKLLTKSPSHSLADYRKQVIEECVKLFYSASSLETQIGRHEVMRILRDHASLPADKIERKG